MHDTTGSFDGLFLAFQEALAGRYSLERELGRGGMGVVYGAREVRLDRPVAIKLLPPELAALPKLRERFLREARTAARLSHPYIVPIHAVDEVGGFVFFVMAYVDGETLAERVRSRGPLRPAEATRILREVAWALAYAHGQGVIHRDIKPANILLERGTERAMVMDFGIARLAHASGETAVGELLGTPEYMSPEQASGEAVDARSDIYSLGIVGYFVVTGDLPFSGSSAQAVLAKQITQPAPSLASAGRGLPSVLARALDRCLEKDPAQRMQSGEALADALAVSLEKRVEVPVPVRAFLDDRDMVKKLVLIWIALSPIGPAIGNDVIALAGLAGWIATMSILFYAPPIALGVQKLRRLLKLGYGTKDIASALRASVEERREASQFEAGGEPTSSQRMFGLAGAGALTLSGASAVAMFAGFSTDVLAPLAVISAYAGVVASALSHRSLKRRSGTGSFWADRWEGRMGRWLSGLASIKLGARSIAADSPTEMAIATSARALFDELPTVIRRSLAEFPDVLENLEAQARDVRARIDELDAMLHEAQSGAARDETRGRQESLVTDLRDARAEAEQRLARLVTALETLRLDMLRLRAGRGSSDSVTLDLEAAKALGDDVDRLIGGSLEADEMIRGAEPSPV